MNIILIAVALLSALVTFTPTYIYYQWRLDSEISAREEAVDTARAEITQKCLKAQKNTEEVGNEVREKLEAVNRNLSATVRRVRSEGLRIVPIAVPALGVNAETAKGLPAMVEFDPVEIAERFATCDGQAERLEGWQRFYAKVLDTQ